MKKLKLIFLSLASISFIQCRVEPSIVETPQQQFARLGLTSSLNDCKNSCAVMGLKAKSIELLPYSNSTTKETGYKFAGNCICEVQ